MLFSPFHVMFTFLLFPLKIVTNGKLLLSVSAFEPLRFSIGLLVAFGIASWIIFCGWYWKNETFWSLSKRFFFFNFVILPYGTDSSSKCKIYIIFVLFGIARAKWSTYLSVSFFIKCFHPNVVVSGSLLIMTVRNSE